jgi:aspartyl-tRNA(Asn)/glutamyl-tRNA(Gln) amidotransferase subunit A
MAIELYDGCSALDIHREVRRGAASALEIIAKLADRVAKLNTALNAIVGFDSAAAFEEARRVDRSIASGNVGPLAGAPFTVKDCLWVEGKRATQGSPALSRLHRATRRYSRRVAPRAGAV